MKEELKPSALSSGDLQGKNKQDGHLNLANLGDLNNFLIRRQLLALEGIRVRELLLEAETDLKGKQDNLLYIRDRVFASLRDHLAHHDELIRIENLRRQRLENLPRTVERYLRRRVKRLLGYANSRASTKITDSPVPISAPGWRLPKVGQLDAWTSWFAENDPNRPKGRFRKDRIQVALVVSGGIGDLLKSTHLVRSISDHFSCDLTIIAAQRVVGQVVANNPYVRDTLVPVTQHVYDLADHLRHIPIFDLIIVWRYHVQYVVPVGSRIAREDIQSIESKSSALRKTIEKYCVLHGWHKLNFAFSRDMIQLGLSAMKVSVKTLGLPDHNSDEIPFFPSKQALHVIAELLTDRYVTVHHGFDLLFLPERTRETDYNSTKNISMLQWRQIVSLLRREGVEVIQLGVVEEERIEGVSHYLNGQTSLEESGILIKHSLCHIDTEGGLVHLANAVHTRCVVLFGPTPVEFFGYPQNINLEPSGCKACWFATQNWLVECPRHTDGPECMSGHSASAVAAAAKRIIAESENLSAKLMAAETRPSPAPLAEMVAAARALLSHDATNRIVLILDDLLLDYPPRDIGSELSDCGLDGSDVIICAGKHDNWEPLANRLEFGSLLNLPRASASIDAVIWVSREVEPAIAPFALREIFRVLKPGGQLVFAAAAESTGLDLRQSLLGARIAFDENEMPTAPTYACSLRKGVPSRSGPAISTGSPEAPHRDRNADDPRLAALEQKNRRQIALVRDKAAQREEVMDEARGVVDSAVQRAFGEDGWIWISNLFAEGYPTKFFMRGWHAALDWVIWGREDKCLLMLPFDEEQSSRGNRLELQLHLALPKTSEANPAEIGVRIDDWPIENFRLSTDDEILTIRSPIDASKFRGVSLVEFDLRAKATGEQCDRLPGTVAMGVKRFRYRLLRGEDELSVAANPDANT